MDANRSALRLLFVLPVLFLGLFFFYPLASILTLGLAPSGRLDPGPVAALFTTPYYAHILWFTTWQAGLSTLLTLAAALPSAYVFARYDFRGKSLLMSLATVPFVLPTVVVANAFSALLGPNGQVNAWLMGAFGLDAPPVRLQFTVWAILLAHVFYNYAVVLRIVGGFWSNLHPRLPEAARMLGASPLRAWWEVTLPLLAPALLASALLVFIFCFTSFGVILVLGGPRFATLEVEIYRQAAHLFNLPAAAALSVLQMAFTFVAMGVYTTLQARMSRPLQSRPQSYGLRRPRTLPDHAAVGANVAFMGVLLLLPMAALVERSLGLGGGISLKYYLALFTNMSGSVFYVPPYHAAFNSLRFALVTVLMSLPLGLILAYTFSDRGEGGRMRGWLISILDPLFMLPLSVSAVTLGFGYVIALDELRSGAALVPIAHTLVALPFVTRSLLPAIRSVDPELREAASMLGATPVRAWCEIELPLIWRALLVATVFAFTVSMGEFGATMFVARPQTPTMPVAIYRFLGQPGALNYGQSLAMSVLLMLVCAAGFLAIERFRLRGVAEF